MSFVKQLLQGVALGFADGALDFGFNQAVMNQQMNHQKELMDYQAKIRHDQWEEENAYNHPAMQMARLRQAGLNPALMNGAGVQPTSATLTSTPNAGAPSGANRQTNISQRMAALSQLLTDERNRGLLSEETRLLAQKVINEKIESDIKAIARDTGYTEQKIREMDKEALYEAYYGESVFGGVPRIINNPIKIDMDNARAAAEYSLALKVSEEHFRQYRIELMEAQTDAEREKANESMANAVRAYASADFARAEKIYLRHKNSREAAQHQMNLTIDRLRKQGMISENQVAEYKAKIDQAWDEGVFGDDAKGHRLGNLATMWNSFIHNNLNLSGAGGITKIYK